jgi:hypothetical protein
MTDRRWLTPGVTKSRWRMGKSSGGDRRLDRWAVEDNSDTCRVVWPFGHQNHQWTVFGFGPQNSGAFLAGIESSIGVITRLVSRQS